MTLEARAHILNAGIPGSLLSQLLTESIHEQQVGGRATKLKKKKQKTCRLEYSAGNLKRSVVIKMS